MLHKLVEQENIRGIAIPIDEETREDFTVVETSTGHEYRFVSNGPHLSETEWRNCLDGRRRVSRSRRLCRGERQLFRSAFPMISTLGSRRSRAAGPCRSRSTLRAPRFGAALDHGVDLLKPSLGEMRELTGQPLADPASCVAACKSLVAAGKSKTVALTLGSQGAILATPEGHGAPGRCPSMRSARSAPATVSSPRWSARSPPACRRRRRSVTAWRRAPPPCSPRERSFVAPTDVRELLEHVVVDRAAQCLASFV